MDKAILGLDDYLISYLRNSIKKAKKIDLNVAFLTEMGVKLIGPDLLIAKNRGAEIKILTGRYLSYTEPSAIYYLFDLLGKDLRIRFFNKNAYPFHPKAYFFDYGKEQELFIGSSNLTRSALTSGVEWNYRFYRSEDPEAFDRFKEEFERLFNQQAYPITEEKLRQYALSWNKPRISFEVPIEEIEAEIPEPRGAQIEALYEMKNSREEGVEKGLVVAATGVGKTYISVFDAKKFDRILFIAHREEILRQTYESFKKVMPEKTIGYYSGKQKETGTDICLATVQSLSRDQHLKKFSPDYFNYIVVDEFHHAAANSYKKVIDYFNPDFLLGLTATPYRMDNRDIFALCDDNVLYEIGLKESINRDLLVPFKYYGIYDPTMDYEKITWRSGRYVIDELERELSKKERADLIFEKYSLIGGKKALGFCVSIAHAVYMAEFFSKKGKKAAAVVSGGLNNTYKRERQKAVEDLENGNLDVIFAVDIFNEGVDIPSVDTVMFLRPTDSYVVFLQQLGRGLRKDEGKRYLKVLDFIGNYKRAHYLPVLLSGGNPMEERLPVYKIEETEYPIDCHVQFDFEVIDLFEKMAKYDPLPQRMKDEFIRIKEELGKRPNRVNIFEGTDIPMREFLREGWIKFLFEIGELKKQEEKWLDTPAEDFLKVLEKTMMTKAYKIPTLKALITEDGSVGEKVSLEEIGKSFIEFYHGKRIHEKDLQTKGTKNWKKWGVKEFSNLAKKNPVHFLSKDKFFHFDEINENFYLDDSIKPYLDTILREHIEDILEYRRIQFFRRRYKEIE